MKPATLPWFARHELRLAFRDLIAMLRGGRRRLRLWWVVIGLVLVEAVLHAVALAVLEPATSLLIAADRRTVVMVSASALLAWLLFLSQAMESTTRAFYARADLDLLLSSPAPVRLVFAVRIAAIAATTVVTAAFIAGPAIDAMALIGGIRFLCAYIVLIAMGLSAAAMAVGLTALMFQLLGPRRTRMLAQVAAAVIGAGFVVGIQAAAVIEHGSLSRLTVIASPEWIAAMPSPESLVWWPFHAATGAGLPLATLTFSAVGVLILAMVLTAGSFARNVVIVAGLPGGPRPAANNRAKPFRVRSPAAALRRKEWVLLWRDPWLVSQSLMQILYLLPPALMLWHSYGNDRDTLVILVPVLVMAAGQIAGGLAWLAISGEDAPDLIATAPVRNGAVLRAKIEAVALAVALPLAPLALAIAVASPFIATTTVVGAALAAAGASAVQYFFRVRGKRSGFRRRQTASRIATFAEAIVSIAIAAGAGLTAAGTWFAIAPLGLALAVVAAARMAAGSGP